MAFCPGLNEDVCGGVVPPVAGFLALRSAAAARRTRAGRAASGADPARHGGHANGKPLICRLGVLSSPALGVGVLPVLGGSITGH